MPPDIRVGICTLDSSGDSDKHRNQTGRRRRARQIERQTGRRLIEVMVEKELGFTGVHISQQEDGKPLARCDQASFHLSISHSPVLVCGAVSVKRILGLDIEQTDRAVSAALMSRIRHPDETDDLYRLSGIRIWTLKESVLKWSGRGLRMAMSEIRVDQIEEELFCAFFDDRNNVEICSFRERGHWIAVAY